MIFTSQENQIHVAILLHPVQIVRHRVSIDVDAIQHRLNGQFVRSRSLDVVNRAPERFKVVVDVVEVDAVVVVENLDKRVYPSLARYHLVDRVHLVLRYNYALHK